MSAPASSRPVPTSFLHTHRKLIIGALAAFVIAAAAGGGYGLWFILIGPSSPASVTAAFPSGAGVAAPAPLDGTWNVDTSRGSIGDGTASFVGYRVQEQLVGVGGHTAVGRTPKVTG